MKTEIEPLAVGHSPSAAHHPTTAGNYFVSNYPPFSFWRPDAVGDFFAALQRPPQPETPLGVYLHIPFCRKRCHFCYFRVYTGKDSAAIKGYIDAALKELAVYARQPIVDGRKPNFVYFGGGTPSYLSANQLQQLTEGMKALLPWDQVEEVTFECEPGTLTDHKLKAIRELGITRLSLGVENFSDHILEINGRAHRSKEIWRAYSYARELGFPQINIDLIAGMVEETEENWRDCIRKTIDLSPDSVTIYQMEIPYNTIIYKEMKAEGRLVAPIADWEQKRDWVDEAFAELEKVGYKVASAYTAVKDKTKARFVYRDKFWAGADLLALGVASFGHIGGTHYQNHHDFEPYVSALNAGKLPVYRALTPTDDERLIREFVLQLKLGSVSAEYFAKKFGVDPRERFAEPLRRLRDWGFAEIDRQQIKINREGLLQVDRLLHEFFLPEHRNARYAYAASLLKPLADFYVGRALPEVRFVEAARIPQAYRQLLDHSNDMTSTLQRFHDEEIRVQVLESRQDDTRYEREVLLVTRDTRRTVEFGAIEILFEGFPTGAQREIFRAELPLGAILRSFRIEYKSEPRAFFEIKSDDTMNEALKLSHTQTLYGRCNAIRNVEGQVLAEIVEILPPTI